MATFVASMFENNLDLLHLYHASTSANGINTGPSSPSLDFVRSKIASSLSASSSASSSSIEFNHQIMPNRKGKSIKPIIVDRCATCEGLRYIIKQVKYRCSVCYGVGTRQMVCVRCKGNATVPVPPYGEVQCPLCSGTPYKIVTCQMCSRGEITRPETVDCPDCE